MEDTSIKRAIASVLEKFGDEYMRHEKFRNEMLDAKRNIGLNIKGTDEEGNIELFVYPKDEVHDRFDIEIETPPDLSAMSKLAGILYITSIVSIRVDRYLRAKRAMSKRSAEVRSRAGKKAIAARWEKAKKAKSEV